MSYGFKVRASTKVEAKSKVAAEFDKVVAGQACHARDRAQAEAAAAAFIDLLDDDESKDVSVGVNGWVGGTWSAGNELKTLNGAHVDVTAELVTKVAA